MKAKLYLILSVIFSIPVVLVILPFSLLWYFAVGMIKILDYLNTAYTLVKVVDYLPSKYFYKKYLTAKSENKDDE